MDTTSTETFRIGELARRVGATPRTVRYYEQLGLLPERGRERGTHRLYDSADEAELRELIRRPRPARAVAPGAARVVERRQGPSGPARALVSGRARRGRAARDRRRVAPAHRNPARTRTQPASRARTAGGRARVVAPPRALDLGRCQQGGRVSHQRSLQVDRPEQHHHRHADGDDQLVDRPDRPARHLPRYPPQPAGAGQHHLSAVDDDGLHGVDRRTGRQLRPDR